jgi:hypothetical protein
MEAAMSRVLLALLLGGSAAGWFYFMLDKRSIQRQAPNLVASLLGGLFVFIIIYSLTGSLF